MWANMIIILLSVGFIGSLIYSYRSKKRWIAECERLKATLDQRESAVNTIKSEYQSLAETSKALFVDPITALPTYKVFFEQLQRAIVESQRYSFYLGLCFIEIHNKQSLMDEDIDEKELFVAECAQQLRGAIRKIDFLAHYEGNTFVLLLTGLNQPEKAGLAAQRVFDVLAKSAATSATAWNKVVSIGIAIFPSDADSEKTLIAHSLHALAVAKQKGRSAYQFYEPSLHKQSQREHQLVKAMNNASFFDQLELVYHPVIALAQNKVLAMSVELQWKHPTLGLVSQSECMLWADKQNRLIGMMVWQLEQACRYFVMQREQGFAIACLMVSIPFSLLKNSRFIHGLQQWLTKWQFSPEWLWLQVQGDVHSISLDEFEKAANMLHYLNIKLVIEQQNEQALPFSYFARVPFTYYKLSDKMFASMLESAQISMVLRAMSQFMNQLSIQLIVSDADPQAKRDFFQQAGVALVERKSELESIS